MDYLAEYSKAMDYVRERLGLGITASLYECVVKFVEEFKKLDAAKSEAKTSVKKEKKDVRGKTGKRSGTGGSEAGGDPWDV